MDIIRIVKEDGLNKYFEEITKAGLVSYSALGFKKYYWQYKENPFYLTQSPSIWLYSLDGKTVGHLGAIPVELKAGSTKILAAWAVDFAILPAYRRKGIGMSLISEANKNFAVFLAIGATGMSLGLFRKMGWQLLGDLPHYIKILNLKNLMKEKIKNKFMLNLMFLPASILFNCFGLLAAKKKPKDIDVYKLDSFSEEADFFWKKIADSYKIIVPRNKAYLNWKYDRQPDMRYVKFRALRNGNLCGYIVVRCIKKEADHPEGLITDIIACPADKAAVQALVFTALEYLKSEGCSIVCGYASDNNIQKVFKIYGFVRRKSYFRFLINKNLSDLAEADSLNNWHITAGDSDIDR